MLPRVAILVSFLLAAGCFAPTSYDMYTFGYVATVRTETASVRIELDKSAAFVWRAHKSPSGESSSSTTLDGHDFGVRDDDTFFVGESTYGAVGQGSLVRVKDRAVTIDDEPRGTLPDPTAAESEARASWARASTPPSRPAAR